MAEYVYPMPPTMPPVINDAWSQADEADRLMFDAERAIRNLSLYPPQRLDLARLDNLSEMARNVRLNCMTARHICDE